MSSINAPSVPIVPIVDLSQDTASILQSLHRACSEGCFYVINHGVDKELVEAMFQQSAAFYNQPHHVEAALAAAEGSKVKSGWHSSGSVTVDKSQTAPDTRELLRIALSDVDVSRHPLGKDGPIPELLTGPAASGLPLWPDQQLLPDFQPTMVAYFTAVNSLAQRLIRLSGLALGLRPEALLEDDAAAATPAWQTLMLLHYPAQPTDTQQGQFAGGAHKDRFTHFTILANTPGSSGLEAQAADGSWFQIPPMEGAFIVNVGSVLEMFSNGVFKAPLHRVVNPSGKERYSTPFYHGCAPDTIIRPLVPAPADSQQQYSPIKCSDYMAGFAAAFKCKTEAAGAVQQSAVEGAAAMAAAAGPAA